MVIYGLHTGHDSASAKIEENKLIYSHELEKFNQPRYSYIKTAYHANSLIPNFNCDNDSLIISGEQHLGQIEVDGKFAYYSSVGYASGIGDNPLKTKKSILDFFGSYIPIETTYHTTCHLVGSYCCSPFMKRGEDAFVCMWDGGVNAMVFYISYDNLSIKYLGDASLFNGNVFSYISLYWGPLKLPGAIHNDFRGFTEEMHERLDRTKPDHLNWRGAPGILMAYQGLGKYNEKIVPLLKTIEEKSGEHFPRGWDYKKMSNALRQFSDEDIIATIYGYLGQTTMDNLADFVRSNKKKTPNMILTGGCALNIKWNSYFRSLNVCNEVWAPPFPNDCGIALGAATTKMVLQNKSWEFDWDVYRGQELITSGYTKPYKEKWKRTKCSLTRLAEILYYDDEPIVFLKGRAELGPRALGHRSILASPKNLNMKQRLNEVKGRASFRPVAPICMEEHAPEYFTPGTPDPFMLFDHEVKEEVKDFIPAVIHVDNTARLQTINEDQEPDVYELLFQFYQLSGIPMLCNTSANDKGKGFFPSLTSALDWERTKYVWAEGYLYEKVD